mmetsp:Transcript_29075/g.51106  ORF Transcript_29075/g.51106 Transcript_29075/m.51106 type:complete len:288 (+) Transcript_29075:1-864(+)
MPNHNSPSDAGWTFNRERNAFVITARRALLPGAQVFISYGRKPNLDFLMFYGFCLSSNMKDSVAVDFHLGPLCWKRQLSLSRNGQKLPSIAFSMLRIFAYFALSEENDAKTTLGRLTKYLRKRCKSKEAKLWKKLDGKELKTLNQRGPSFLTVDNLKEIRCGPVSVRNELFVLDMIQKTCKSSLSKYPTTLEEDKHLRDAMESQEKKGRSYIKNLFALRLRMGEKRVLKWHVDLYQFANRCIKSDYKSLNDDVLNNEFEIYRKSSACRTYWERVLRPLMKRERSRRT